MTTLSALPAIQAHNLTLVYPREPETPALEGIDLAIPTGQVVGLLGKSGAGKTSLLRVLGGLAEPNKGQVKIFGHLLRPLASPENLHTILVENSALDPRRPLSEIIPATGPEAQDLLHCLGLRPYWNKLLGNLPQTLQYRAALASSLAAPADQGIFLVDELPGLDSETASALQAWLPDWAHGLDQTILLASRIPAVVLSLCDRVIILREGRLAQDCWIADLEKRPAGASFYRLRMKGQLDAGRASWFPGLSLYSDSNDTVIEGEIPDQAGLHSLLARIRDLGLPLEQVAHVRPAAEDILRGWM